MIRPLTVIGWGYDTDLKTLVIKFIEACPPGQDPTTFQPTRAVSVRLKPDAFKLMPFDGSYTPEDPVPPTTPPTTP